MINCKFEEEMQILFDKYKILLDEAFERDIVALAGRKPKDNWYGEYHTVNREFRKERDVIRRKYGLET